MTDIRVASAIESPVVVASNRGPISFERADDGGFVANRGAGGLVTALSGVFYRDDAMWVSAAMTEADRAVPADQATDSTSDLRLRLLSVPEDTYNAYYNGMANGVLWFTHHFLWDVAREPVFDDTTAAAWEAFVEVNRRFAETLADMPDDPVFLIQDYHLALVPRMLRELRPDARIAHFTHTPFADHTYLRILPVAIREALLRGMAAADVIGFQTRTWAENFILSMRGLQGIKVDLGRGRMAVDGRTALVRTFPVAIAGEPLRSLAGTPDVRRTRRELQRSLGDERLLLRVDRLEPSKNIIRGFRAFECFLKRSPEFHGRVRFMALFAPSREEMAEYQAYGDESLAEVKRINAEYGTDDWTPIDVRVQHDLPFAIAAYGLYDALLVNPVFDGMNLVPMEGPLVNRNKGALILSRNAGAFGRLGRHAIGVNPFDVNETADAIGVALRMPQEDRARRSRAMSRVVLAHTPASWLADQLDAVDQALRLRGRSA